ncbi:MAG: methyltransferase domain-containing protein [Chloroflexi bacterium]|nr:methyltransferase domain-containing protein [Chloroflexota bacterium]
MRLGSYYRRLVLPRLGVCVGPGPVLDVGSYDGGALAGLSGVHAVGLDRDPAPAGQCVVPMVRGDGCQPPFRPGTFAAVFALDVLEHEEDDRRLAAALVDLLAPGGTLWVSVPHRGYRAVPPMLTAPLHRRWGHVRPGYAADDLAALFGAGVVVEAVEWNEPVFRLLYFPVRLLWRPLPGLARLLLRVAARLDAHLQRGQKGHLFARIVRRPPDTTRPDAGATAPAPPTQAAPPVEAGSASQPAPRASGRRSGAAAEGGSTRPRGAAYDGKPPVAATLGLLALSALVVGCGPGSAPGVPGPAIRQGAAPVLAPGAPESWDSGAIHAPQVLKLNEGYVMWYDGTAGTDPYRGWSIGRATSADGITWERDPPTPVLTPGAPGAWDGVSVHDPRVVYDGTSYRMWYSGFDGERWQIGLARSEDGVTWTRHAANPVLRPGSPDAWDGAGVAYSSVVRRGAAYHMWYQGGDRGGVWRIGYATSLDGLTWTKHPANPVLDLGPPGSWDSARVFTPAVVPVAQGLVLWYSGAPRWGLGYATSSDGVSWQRGGRVLALGPPGAWDGEQVLTPTALWDAGGYRLWYAGSQEGRLAIGLALASPGK